jgi:MSHA biogenesis protein MshP
MVVAIFLIVGLALMITYLSTISTSSQTSSLADFNASRTYQTAPTGAGWGIFQVMRNSAGSFATQCAAGSAIQRNQTYGGTLAAFTASITCTGVAMTEGGGTVTAYSIQSNACNIPAAGACPNTTTTSQLYVERQVNLTVVQ